MGRGGRGRRPIRVHGQPPRSRSRGAANRQDPGEQSGGDHQRHHGQPRGRSNLRLAEPVTDGQSARERGTTAGTAAGLALSNFPAFALAIAHIVEDALAETVHVALAHAVRVAFSVTLTIADVLSISLAVCVGRRGLPAHYERSVRLQ